MFHSQIQYSLLNWGRAAKNHLRKVEVLRNNILKACLFRPRNYPTTSLYSKLIVVKIKDMFQMEIAKFMFKFNNLMLPFFFDSYFTKLDKVLNYNTRQKSRNEFHQSFVGSEIGKKSLHQMCLNSGKSIPLEKRHCSFYGFKKYFKTYILNQYNSC